MSHFDEQDIPVAYPPSKPMEEHTNLQAMAPPPLGYPTKEDANIQTSYVTETQSRGDGFWKGCAAALCCCCVLDCCF